MCSALLPFNRDTLDWTWAGWDKHCTFTMNEEKSFVPCPCLMNSNLPLLLFIYYFKAISFYFTTYSSGLFG